jgi:hypothetical protein
MSGWVKFDTPQPGNRIGLFGQNDAVEFGLINPTQLHHWTAVGGALDVIIPNTAPWTHILITGDAAGRTVYLDGVQAGTGSTSLGSGSAFPFNIGGGGIYDASGNFFTGCIDEVAIWDVLLTEDQIAQLASCEITPLGPRNNADRLGLDVRRTDAGMLELSWNSIGGELYTVHSETDLSAVGEQGPGAWPIYNGHENIVATPPRNALTFPYPADPERFFAIEAFPAPPVSILSDDFENGQGDWTMGSDGAAGTAWELGIPTNGPGIANSLVNCFGTNLNSDYAINANIWLRSPAIDLTTAGGATLNYYQYRDIEEGFDFGVISVLDAADDSLIAEIPGVGSMAFAWELVSKPLPAEALGKIIKIEFRLTSDEIETFPGWFIDDLNLTVP